MRRIWHRLFDERPGDALPRELIAVSLGASVAAGWAGWYIDGWTFRGYDVTVNVLASFIVLGPGLFITNILVKRWRDRRDKHELRKAVAKPIEWFVTMFELQMHGSFFILTHQIPGLSIDPPVFATGYVTAPLRTLQRLISVLDDALIALQDHPDVAQRCLLGGWSPTGSFSPAVRSLVGDIDRHVSMAGCATEVETVEAALDGLAKMRRMARDLEEKKRLRADAGVNYARKVREALDALDHLLYGIMWAVEDELGMPRSKLLWEESAEAVSPPDEVERRQAQAMELDTAGGRGHD
ncbi:MAG: hypothetical protein QG671_293 [Actinomycetota bacterium]|nr:hypothetical protein [Actinomycetota bacterium]